MAHCPVGAGRKVTGSGKKAGTAGLPVEKLLAQGRPARTSGTGLLFFCAAENMLHLKVPGHCGQLPPGLRGLVMQRT